MLLKAHVDLPDVIVSLGSITQTEIHTTDVYCPWVIIGRYWTVWQVHGYLCVRKCDTSYNDHQQPRQSYCINTSSTQKLFALLATCRQLHLSHEITVWGCTWKAHSVSESWNGTGRAVSFKIRHICLELANVLSTAILGLAGCTSKNADLDWLLYWLGRTVGIYILAQYQSAQDYSQHTALKH